MRIDGRKMRQRKEVSEHVLVQSGLVPCRSLGETGAWLGSCKHLRVPSETYSSLSLARDESEGRWDGTKRGESDYSGAGKVTLGNMVRDVS